MVSVKYASAYTYTYQLKLETSLPVILEGHMKEFNIPHSNIRTQYLHEILCVIFDIDEF